MTRYRLPPGLRILWFLQRRRLKPIHELSLRGIQAMRRHTLPRNLLTARLFGRPVPGVQLADREIPGPQGPIPIRVYTPPAATAASPEPGRAVVVNFHGGGWTVGNLDQTDWICTVVADRVGAVVVSVDYRLAPEHPFPAALEDAYAAVGWVAAEATGIGGDSDRLAVMGDSAGGNLAATVCLKARDEAGPRIRQQTLIYPTTDVTMSNETLDRYADAPIITRRDVEAFADHYAPEGIDRTDPYLSPLHAEDLSGLPPALVITAEYDPLVGEGRDYAERLREANVDVRYTEYPRMPHGFLSFPGASRGAKPAVAEICQELRRHL